MLLLCNASRARSPGRSLGACHDPVAIPSSDRIDRQEGLQLVALEELRQVTELAVHECGHEPDRAEETEDEQDLERRIESTL